MLSEELRAQGDGKSDADIYQQMEEGLRMIAAGLQLIDQCKTIAPHVGTENTRDAGCHNNGDIKPSGEMETKGGKRRAAVCTQLANVRKVLARVNPKYV